MIHLIFALILSALFVTVVVLVMVSIHNFINPRKNSFPDEIVPKSKSTEEALSPTKSKTEAIFQKTEASISIQPDYKMQAEHAEAAVDKALRHLDEGRYFVFRDLIIPSSSKKLRLTQIDHVLVSRMGIFCIETKSTRGNIYGFTRNEHWKQYLGNAGTPYQLNSPFRQNKHHVSSLELLLSTHLKSPVHSYLAFPNANKVVVDRKVEDMTPQGVVKKISNHTKIIYDASDVERIAKILAHAGTFREELRDRHIEDVKTFLDAKVSKTLKVS